MDGGFEDAGFADRIVRGLTLGGGGEFKGDELIVGGVIGFVDGGEESRLVVCSVWVGANLLGW